MERPHSGRRQFFHAFFLGLAVLSLPFSVALMRFAGSGVFLPETQEAYYPQSADALTLIAAGRTVGGERPNCFVLCRIDPAAGEVRLCVLPPEPMVEDVLTPPPPYGTGKEARAGRRRLPVSSAAAATGGWNWMPMRSAGSVSWSARSTIRWNSR